MMTNTDWELLPPRQGITNLTITRTIRGEGNITIAKRLQKEINITDNHFCYIRRRGKKLMLIFVNDPIYDGYKVFSRNSVAIPGQGVLGEWLERATKKSVEGTISNGNIIVNLDDLENAKAMPINRVVKKNVKKGPCQRN